MLSEVTIIKRHVFLVYIGARLQTCRVLWCTDSVYLCFSKTYMKPSENGEMSAAMNETTLAPIQTELGPWQSEAEHAPSRLRMLPTILNLYE